MKTPFFFEKRGVLDVFDGNIYILTLHTVLAVWFLVFGADSLMTIFIPS
jgi:hypothetical protein